MATKYLLPCQCGNALSIDTSQAGQTLTCTCGRTVDVPSMRVIRTLEPDPSATSESRRTARTIAWNPTSGMIFAAGALLIVAGLAIGGLGTLYRVHLTVPPPPQERVEMWINQVDQIPPDELWELWKVTVVEGLGEYGDSDYIIHRTEARFFRGLANIGFGIAGIGFLTVIGASLFRKKRTAS